MIFNNSTSYFEQISFGWFFFVTALVSVDIINSEVVFHFLTRIFSSAPESEGIFFLINNSLCLKKKNIQI